MKKLLISAFLLTALASCKGTAQDVYMFSYFTGNGEDGLHFAYSHDGFAWQTLDEGRSFLTPLIGKHKLMRDPSIVQDSRGLFHMVWTTGWWDQGIGYASSEDLVHWSAQQNIPVMEKFEGTRNSWAPELFYDEDSDTFYIFWSSTVPGAFPEIPTAANEKGLNHRQYYVTTRDFKKFSETKLYFEPGFSVIDGTVLKKDDVYYLFIKNENSAPAEKNIRVTSSDKPYDFPVEVSEPIARWAEGPTAIEIGEYVYVYFDKYTSRKYGAVRSKDMITWEDVSDLMSFPQGMRHGTVFKVSRKIFNRMVPER